MSYRYFIVGKRNTYYAGAFDGFVSADVERPPVYFDTEYEANAWRNSLLKHTAEHGYCNGGWYEGTEFVQVVKTKPGRDGLPTTCESVGLESFRYVFEELGCKGSMDGFEYAVQAYSELVKLKHLVKKGVAEGNYNVMGMGLCRVMYDTATEAKAYIGTSRYPNLLSEFVSEVEQASIDWQELMATV